MKKREWKNICLILLLFVIAPGFGQTVKATEEHVPEGITMQTEFKPGYGETLGLFKKAIGKVVLIHTSDTSGYWAENDLPIYMKDTVVTPEEGLALLQFLDESTISVAEDSELTINRFIFDPDKLDRSTFINMQSGQARFWVKKLQGYTRSEFKIKTKTMVAGVRGTNLVVSYHGDNEDREQVLRGQAKVLITEPQQVVEAKEGEELVGKKGGKADSGEEVVTVFVLEGEVEVISLKNPEKIVIVKGGEKVTVAEGQEVSKIGKITPAETARLKREMPMPSDQSVMSEKIFKTEGAAETKDSKQQPTKEVVPTGKETPEEAVKKETVPTDKAGAVPATRVDQPMEEIKKVEVVKTPAQKEKPKEEVVYAGGEILYPAEELVPPDPLAEFPEELTVIDWPQESLSSPPGAAPAIYDVADGSSPSPAPVPEEAFEPPPVEPPPPITDLPGLPGTPIP